VAVIRTPRCDLTFIEGPGQGLSHQQIVNIPLANTSSLAGALGDQGSRASSSSSRRAPSVSAQQNVATQGQHVDTHGRQSMDKDAIAADVVEASRFLSFELVSGCL
jgi:hypothetical protein